MLANEYMHELLAREKMNEVEQLVARKRLLAEARKGRKNTGSPVARSLYVLIPAAIAIAVVAL